MATVFIQRLERKNKTSYQVRYKDPHTGLNRYSKTYHRQKDAQKAANDLRSLIDDGKLSEVRAVSKKIRVMAFEEVGQSLDAQWQARVERGELGKATHDGYSDRLNQVYKVLGKRLLSEISREEVAEYRNKIASETSKVTSNRNLFVIKQVLKHGVELGAVKRDPISEVRYFSEKDHQRNRFLMPQGIDKLLAGAKQVKARYYLPAIMCLGAEHGASKQEVLDLKWPDINFEFENRGLIHFFRTKTKAERTEYLMPRTREALLEWREHQRWMRHRKRIVDKGPGFVFCRLDGRQLQQFNTAWERAREIAGFSGLHFHDLRHTFCSNLILSGADLKDVKEMIGHRDLSMTDRYSHLTSLRKLSRQDQLARFYAGQVPGSQVE